MKVKNPKLNIFSKAIYTDNRCQQKVSIKIMEKNLFTRNEVAAALGVKARTVYSYQQKGILIPDKYINGRPRYSVESIEAIYTKSNKK